MNRDTITIIINDDEKVFKPKKENDNAGEVYDRAREYLKAEHMEVMREQGKQRAEEHHAQQVAIAEKQRTEMAGEEPPATNLKPDTVRVKTKTKGVN